MEWNETHEAHEAHEAEMTGSNRSSPYAQCSPPPPTDRFPLIPQERLPTPIPHSPLSQPGREDRQESQAKTLPRTHHTTVPCPGVEPLHAQDNGTTRRRTSERTPEPQLQKHQVNQPPQCQMVAAVARA